MSDEESGPGKGKDKWDKLDIILKPVGGLLTAIAVGMLGYFASDFTEKQQANEARVRLYSELMSKREEAESSLRKDMFVSIIQSFVGPEKAALETKVLNLELLAYNFHDALNLKPLFVYLDKKVRASDDPAAPEYRSRLKRVAREVVRKQMMVLEGAGEKFDRTIDFDELAAQPGGLTLAPAVLKLGDKVDYKFSIYVLKVDPVAGEIKVRLEITRPNGSNRDNDASVTEFWVGPYDFPMIDNTRMVGDRRCAIVLNSLNPAAADITVAFFPGTYASLKEKPYFQEVVQQLLGAAAQTDRH